MDKVHKRRCYDWVLLNETGTDLNPSLVLVIKMEPYMSISKGNSLKKLPLIFLGNIQTPA